MHHSPSIFIDGASSFSEVLGLLLLLVIFGDMCGGRWIGSLVALRVRLSVNPNT